MSAARAKRLLDVVVALALLLVLLPALALIALAVVLTSDGPVLHRQRRIGRGGRPFEILKFRSMRDLPDGPPTPLPRPGYAPGGPEWVDRRTRVGAVLRRTSLDELPQLWNVLRGDMSLVGPRPERPEYSELFAVEDGWARRHSVRPGLTGLAQVRGLRGAVPIGDRIAADAHYVERWSLWLDLQILVKTVPAVLRDSRVVDQPSEPLLARVADPVPAVAAESEAIA